jgi:hypothetical protein
MTMHITQFAGLAQIPEGGNSPCPKAPAVGSESITLTAESQQSTALGNSTRLVRVAVEVDAFVAIGADPDAEAEGERMFMPAGTVELLAVGNGMKVAGVTA